jgi:hypothetical protein
LRCRFSQYGVAALGTVTVARNPAAGRFDYLKEVALAYAFEIMVAVRNGSSKRQGIGRPTAAFFVS